MLDDEKYIGLILPFMGKIIPSYTYLYGLKEELLASDDVGLRYAIANQIIKKDIPFYETVTPMFVQNILKPKLNIDELKIYCNKIINLNDPIFEKISADVADYELLKN